MGFLKQKEGGRAIEQALYILSRDTMNAGIRTRTMSRTALQAEYPPEPNQTSL